MTMRSPLRGCMTFMVAVMILSCTAQDDQDPDGNLQVVESEPLGACDFELGLCGWSQSRDDDFDWVVYGGRPTGRNTGPTIDHTPESGRNYLLMNATRRDEGDVTRLVSPEYLATSAGGRCMQFYYHMHGRTMGRLRIYQLTEEGERVVFHRDGNQGSGLLHEAEGWHSGRVNIQSSTPYRLIIEGAVGWSYRSDIALDDITLSDNACPNIPESCGLSSAEARSRRILNGEESSAHQWPWQVLIHIYHATTGGTLQCGGTLITPQWVLTAAHCIEDTTNSLWITNLESVRVSFQMNQAEWEPEEFSLQPEEMIVHEDRTVTANGMGPHDLLLMKLPYALTLDENVNVACLPKTGDSVAVGTQCVISGFGREHYEEGSSVTMQHAYVHILSDKVCSDYHGKDLYQEDNICAGTTSDTAVDACAGDSGGPLVCEKDGHYVLTGVVSFGSRCGFKPYPTPGIYADVAYYRDWIERHIH